VSNIKSGRKWRKESPSNCDRTVDG